MPAYTLYYATRNNFQPPPNNWHAFEPLETTSLGSQTRKRKKRNEKFEKILEENRENGSRERDRKPRPFGNLVPPLVSRPSSRLRAIDVAQGADGARGEAYAVPGRANTHFVDVRRSRSRFRPKKREKKEGMQTGKKKELQTGQQLAPGFI
jgi:hypothetical protein